MATTISTLWVQYLSVAYSEHLATAGIKPSTGAVGSSYDNALAESVIGLYKTELIKPKRPWKGLDDLEIATAEWVDWFNHRRPFEYCDDLTPVEAEHAHYAHHQTRHRRSLKLESLRTRRGGSDMVATRLGLRWTKRSYRLSMSRTRRGLSPGTGGWRSSGVGAPFRAWLSVVCFRGRGDIRLYL